VLPSRLRVYRPSPLAYYGSWDLIFVTQRGACDSTYNFFVNITDGVVTHPNLVRFRGYVARSGAVRASVTVQDKFASGSGTLKSVLAAGRGVAIQEMGVARAVGSRSDTDDRFGANLFACSKGRKNN
jgi:hypothetical protein